MSLLPLLRYHAAAPFHPVLNANAGRGNESAASRHEEKLAARQRRPLLQRKEKRVRPDVRRG